MLSNLAKLLLLVGAVLVLIGGVLYALSRLGLARLPGDFSFGGRNWRVYLPIGTSILLSVLLTVVLYLISRWRR